MAFMDFYSLAAIDPLFESTSRQLLALLSSDNENNDTEDERLSNSLDRTIQFLVAFSTFASLWCAFSCYIYSRPLDGPQGTSFVSFIRRMPFLRWFYQQPQMKCTYKFHGFHVNCQMLPSKKSDPIKAVEMEPLKSTASSNHTSLEMKHEVGGSDNTISREEKISTAVETSPPNIVQRKLLFGLSENMTLIICCLGLLIAYLTWGFMQERIMGHPYGDEDDENNWFKYSSFCVMLNRFFGLLVSTIVLKFREPSGNFAPPYVVSLCALSNMSSSWFQYEALHYVTYPVQTIFKSSKIFITMAVGKLVLKKTFALKKYLNALVVAVGVYIFLSSQKKEKSEDNDNDKHDGNGEGDEGMYFYLGLLLIAAYAFCDAFTSNWQQRIFKATKIDSLEMMQMVNAFTFVVSLCFTFADLFDIYNFYATHNLLIFHSLIMGGCAGFGQILIFYTIQTFGAMKFATVMTTRMMCSVIISILYYGHSISTMGVVGLVITFIALYYQAFSKSGPKKAASTRSK